MLSKAEKPCTRAANVEAEVVGHHVVFSSMGNCKVTVRIGGQFGVDGFVPLLHEVEASSQAVKRLPDVRSNEGEKDRRSRRRSSSETKLLEGGVLHLERVKQEVAQVQPPEQPPVDRQWWHNSKKRRKS